MLGNSVHISLSLVVFAASLARASALSAPDCERVEITISNQTPDKVEIQKVEYRTDDKGWRIENGMPRNDGSAGLDEAGHALKWTGTLRSVLGKRTKLRVTYAHQHGAVSWDNELTQTTQIFVCEAQINQTVAITE